MSFEDGAEGAPDSGDRLETTSITTMSVEYDHTISIIPPLDRIRSSVGMLNDAHTEELPTPSVTLPRDLLASGSTANGPFGSTGNGKRRKRDGKSAAVRPNEKVRRFRAQEKVLVALREPEDKFIGPLLTLSITITTPHACDEERPSCGQCRSRNVSCPGYTREVKFVNISYHQGPSSTTETASGTANGDADVDRKENSNRAARRAIQRMYSNGLSSQGLMLQRATIADSCHSYFLSNVIQNGLDVFGRSNYIDWMAFTPNLDVDEPSLRSALLALGAARLGQRAKDQRLTQFSAQSYLVSLRHLQKLVQNGTRGLRDETLASMMFLAIYEILEGSSTRGLGWASHTKGALSLVRAQGFDVEWSEARHRLFGGLRLSALIHSIGTRRPTYLATPEWTSLPWQESHKEPKHYLLDLMAEIPSLLGQMDTVRYASDPV
ncbi:hypothetical protein BBP40_005842 [Aspergillus hancockii]|nr:hypothetical protein BBP40_005842 [Aspergillus hancockii]